MLVTPEDITTEVILSRLLYQGASLSDEKLIISPVPLIVKTPLLSNSHVRLVPHFPLATVYACTCTGKRASTRHSASAAEAIRLFIINPPPKAQNCLSPTALFRRTADNYTFSCKFTTIIMYSLVSVKSGTSSPAEKKGRRRHPAVLNSPRPRPGA